LSSRLRAIPTDAKHPNHLRIAATWTRTTLSHAATAVGVSKTHLYNIADGRAVASLDLARALADYFGVQVEELFPPTAHDDETVAPAADAGPVSTLG